MIIREKYLKAIRGFYDSDLIKVITGIRRSGKSVILETIINEIKEKTDNIIYLNFEKTTDFAKASSAKELIDYVKKNRKHGKCYCFFDEIQEIDDWQIAVKDLRLDNCSVFVTGSNSKLLSSEFLTLLSGRFVSFRIRPFVYKEIKEYINDKYGFTVSSLNIAQVKDKCGLNKRNNYNKGVDGHKVPACPEKKEKALLEAFKHFGLI